MTTVTDIAHQLIDPVTESADDVMALAIALVERAKALGLVLTVTTVPRRDAPAMGNTDVLVDVQLRREPHHGPHGVLVPLYTPEMQSLFADQLRRRANLERYDTTVGRRRRFSSTGGPR